MSARDPAAPDRGGRPCEARVPAALRAPVDDMLERAAREQAGARLRAGDATLWGPPGAEEIADRLGWLTIAERMLAALPELEAFAHQAREEGFADAVLLGMGGSSLAPEVMRRTFGSRPGFPRLHVLDSTDPDAIAAVQGAVTLERTLFIVSSKSGGTIEPRSLFAHFWSRVPHGSNFIAITDPGTALEQLAREHEFRRVFHGDPEIGGRYSALSPFGIVPAALMGVDVRPLLEGAGAAWDTPLLDPAAGEPGAAPATHPDAAVWLGAAWSALAREGRDKLTFLIAPSLPGLGLWLEQLVAESTGKRSTGILPVADEPPGEPALYGDDRVFVHIPDAGAPDPDLERASGALAAAGHPLFTVPAGGTADLGRIFMLFELAVAVAGWGLQINPFDQPNVQQAKDATTRVLEAYRRERRLPAVEEAGESQVFELLLGAAPPRYVAVMAYVPPSDALDAAAAELRAAIRGGTRATTTFGYGPRFLHSTGQFHKGGPPTGIFLQLLHEPRGDVEIPGEPYTFATLEQAQAIGDLQTLRELGSPAQRLRLAGEDLAAALRALAGRLHAAAAGRSAIPDAVPADQRDRPRAGKR